MSERSPTEVVYYVHSGADLLADRLEAARLVGWCHVTRIGVLAHWRLGLDRDRVKTKEQRERIDEKGRERGRMEVMNEGSARGKVIEEFAREKVDSWHVHF